MSATSSAFDNLAPFVFALVILFVLVPILFFLLFYYYLSQLAGINESLKQIVSLLEEKWFPDDQLGENEPKSA